MMTVVIPHQSPHAHVSTAPTLIHSTLHYTDLSRIIPFSLDGPTKADRSDIFICSHEGHAEQRVPIRWKPSSRPVGYALHHDIGYLERPYKLHVETVFSI